MVRTPRLSLFCGLLALCSVFALGAKADTFTQSGTFATDNDVVTFAFATSISQNYTFYTTSYTGGVNANGTTTAAGGFDPVLSLFNADGTLFNGTGPVVSNGGSDANLSQLLGPGSYILALTEFPNFSTDATLTGFSPTNGAFISSVCGTSTSFVDVVDCSQRSGSYTVNYTSTASSAVTPEPSSALLVLLPLAGVVVMNRRKLMPHASF